MHPVIAHSDNDLAKFRMMINFQSFCKNPDKTFILAECAGNCYPLYYFGPSITAPRSSLPPWLVYHVNIGRTVQLAATNLETGVSVELTHSVARGTGWAIWCEPDLDGIYNHLSALNALRREVFYFDDTGLRGVMLDSRGDRLVRSMPDRVPIGQTCFSPDGSKFSFIHADRTSFDQGLETRTRRGWSGHEQWRRETPCVVETIDAATGQTLSEVQLDFHVHHVLYLTPEILLLNHQADGDGMWTMHISGDRRRNLRPADEHGRVCHQVVTANGIWYETRHLESGATYIGNYNPELDRWSEFLIPFKGYHHTGLDPAGKRLIIEVSGERHLLVEVMEPFDESRRQFIPLLSLEPYPSAGQRFHAHPFITHCGRFAVFTSCKEGRGRVCALPLE